MTRDDLDEYLDGIIDSIQNGLIDDTSLVTHLVALAEEIYGISISGKRLMAYRAKVFDLKAQVVHASGQGARLPASEVIKQLEHFLTTQAS